MKKWLTEHFLPMWAKETVLAENRQLRRELREKDRKIQSLQAYIAGMTHALRVSRRRKGEEA